MPLHCAQQIHSLFDTACTLKYIIYKTQSKRIYAISFARLILRALNISYKCGILHPISLARFETLFRDIFIRYKLKLNKDKEKEKEKNVKKEIYIAGKKYLHDCTFIGEIRGISSRENY